MVSACLNKYDSVRIKINLQHHHCLYYKPQKTHNMSLSITLLAQFLFMCIECYILTAYTSKLMK